MTRSNVVQTGSPFRDRLFFRDAADFFTISRYIRPVRRLMVLLTMLSLAFGLAAGSGARASSPVPCAEVERPLDGDAHYEGDADEVPADADGGYPHHHGAGHDHGTFVPHAHRAPVHGACMTARPLPRRHDRTAGAVPDPALRPPRA